MRKGLRALALACAFVAGCAPSAGTLSVDLVTDLVPGVEMFSVRTTIAPAGTVPDPATAQLVPLDLTADFTEGDRIAELRNQPPGEYHVTIELLDGFGDLLVRRTLDVRMSGSFVLRVVVSRDCVFLRCPGVGDPATSTECLAGRCVDPVCTDATCMDPECQIDADCPALEAECASSRCLDGVCLAVITPGECPAGTACSPDVGCVPIVDPTSCVPEICGDGVDQDCNGADLVCAADGDGDGWGADEDCDDANAAVSPAATEVCGNTIDEDCDGIARTCSTVDADGDGWSPPDDCNDATSLINPDGVDICGDLVDQDCSEGDEWERCAGGYGQACEPFATCDTSPRQRLVCTRARGATMRQCLRCCIYCENDTRFHWLNVSHDCETAASRYCSQPGRGGLLDDPAVDPAQWGTCRRL